MSGEVRETLGVALMKLKLRFKAARCPVEIRKVPQESVGHVRQHSGYCCVPSSPLTVQGKGPCSEIGWQFWNVLSYVKSLSSLGVADNKSHLAAASLKAGHAVSQSRLLLMGKREQPWEALSGLSLFLCTELGLYSSAL